MTTESTAPLRLPDGREVMIGGGANDLSIMAALRYQNGAWEPHVTALYATVVQPDWVCIDIGANLGTHSLALATLASRGHVHGLEAAPETFQHLVANIAAAGLADRATADNIAIWRAAGRLRVSVCAELEGCAFVSDEADLPEAEAVKLAEQRLRTVVNNPTIAAIPLHITSTLMDAVSLDDWAEARGLDRLDLIKIDVEGSEWRVLEGASRTLDRFRPLVVTEYNPACAEAYFQDTPWRYFEQLSARFSAIFEITPTGPDRVADWDDLQRRIAGNGWCDLVCTSTDEQTRALSV